MSSFTTCDRCGRMIAEAPAPPLVLNGPIEQDPRAVEGSTFGFFKITVAFCQFFHADGRVDAGIDLCRSCVAHVAANARS